MSRTIAHTPWEIARHNGALRTTIDHDHSNGECRIETLQDVRRRFDTESLDVFGAGRLRLSLHWRIPCRPEPLWYQHRKFAQNHPPRGFVRNTFTKPARQKARIALHNAKREYNTYGETDIEPEPYRSGHEARRMWDMY